MYQNAGIWLCWPKNFAKFVWNLGPEDPTPEFLPSLLGIYGKMINFIIFLLPLRRFGDLERDLDRDLDRLLRSRS